METTMNTQNHQLSVDPNAQVNANVNPNELAVNKDLPKTEGQAENCEMMKADTELLSGGGVAAQQAQKDQTAQSDRPREQLRRRVMARVADLEKELANTEGKDGKSEHASALRVELDIAKDATGGGWEHVGEVEAARLSKWLETSQVLVGSGPADPASAGANLDPANGGPRNTRLAADGAVAVDGSDTSVKATQTSSPATRSTP